MKSSAQECTKVLAAAPMAAKSDEDVFDLSAMMIKTSDGNQSQSPLGCSPCSTPPPSLETSTACTDDDSVSSVSTQGSSSIQRRSVFSQYWKQTGQDPSLRRISRASPMATIAASSPLSLPENHLNVLPTQPEHEVVLDVIVPIRSSPHCLRRSILPSAARSYSVPSQLSSYPSLCPASTSSADARSCYPRKTQSSPQLGQKQPGASCLRASRFSPVKAQASSSPKPSTSPPTTSSPDDNNSDHFSISSSVRFDMNAIAIRHFERPQENYAEEGWSEYFQYGIN